MTVGRSGWAATGTAAIYVFAGLVAIFFASLTRDSAFVGGDYIPATNDSFYHARRILDTVESTADFYEYDTRLQVPEGTWIPWPWGYDYLLAKVVRIGAGFSSSLDATTILAYFPVAWTAVNAALFLLAGGALGLSLGFRAALMLMFSISPLIQIPHSVGMIDHHHMELSFVLLNTWLGLRWLASPEHARAAALLGVALGVAQAFHNGLFILQIPLLATAGLLWIRGTALPKKSVAAFTVALSGSTLLALLPSTPFREFVFEFALLSWFHLYVAACSSIMLVFMAWRPMTPRATVTLIVLASALASPLLADLMRGVGFIGSEFSVLAEIVEARSPYRLFVDSYGPAKTASFYSWLLLLVPVLLAVFLFRSLTQDNPADVFFAVITVFGLGLMLMQYRFYYHGLFVLYAGLLWLVQHFYRQRNWHPGLVAVAVLAVISLAFQPALRGRLFTVYALGADPHYAEIRPLLLELGPLCGKEPGVVLANHDDGNYILFHSDCSVVANNFIMRDSDEEKINELDSIMRSRIEDIRSNPLGFRYLLLRTNDFSMLVDGRKQLVTANSLARNLLADSTDLPAGFEHVLTAYDETGGEDVVARLYRISSPEN